MSMVTLTVPCPICGEELEVEAYVEPEDRNYGADADGNRGIHLPACVVPPDVEDVPACDCGEPWSDADKAKLRNDLKDAAESYHVDHDGPDESYYDLWND